MSETEGLSRFNVCLAFYMHLSDMGTISEAEGLHFTRI